MTASERRYRELPQRIESLIRAEGEPGKETVSSVVEILLEGLESGAVRAATPCHDGTWQVHPWVKTGILLGFKYAAIQPWPPQAPRFRDKDLYFPRELSSLDDVRLVPGGSAIRRGAHVGRSVVLMPPCYVNVGAYVGSSAMIDSHALVGSCAQIGEGVHLSAGVQVGGVLEPPGASPVVVEDGAFIGALSGLFEGVRVCKEAVIGAGVILTASTPVFDLGENRVIRRGVDGVLTIPERAVVIAGSRSIADGWAKGQGLSLSAAVIVKRRDEGTDARAALESTLR